MLAGLAFLLGLRQKTAGHSRVSYEGDINLRTPKVFACINRQSAIRPGNSRGVVSKVLCCSGVRITPGSRETSVLCLKENNKEHVQTRAVARIVLYCILCNCLDNTQLFTALGSYAYRLLNKRT